MVTRTGDPTAELLALLREHCPTCAEETLQQIAAGIVAGDDSALRWRRMTLGSIPGVEQFVGAVEPPVQAIGTVLSVVSGILDVVSALLIDITDPFRALIMAAYEILKDIVDDLLGSGAYVYTDAPGLVTNQAVLTRLGVPSTDLPTWLAGGTAKKPAAPADGFGAWAARFQQSFDDPGDDHRPQFSDGAPLTAVFIVAAMPQLPDLARFGSLFATLLDTKAFEKAVQDFLRTFPDWPDDPDMARLNARSVAPDWRSWRLRDIGPDAYPLRELEKVPELLKALLVNGDSIVALLRALIAAVQDKIRVLQEMVDLVKEVIALLKALSASGLHVLPVATNEGVEGLVAAFTGATNRPGTNPDGTPAGTNAIIGACVLAGGSEIDPVAALSVWALLGQSGSMDQAFAGLTSDVDSLVAGSRAAVADAGAALSDAWHGAEGGGPTGQDAGILGLLTDARGELTAQGEAFLAALGMSADEAAEAARSDRVGLAAAVDGARAAGVPVDPLALAHQEATRRAQRRGARSLAMSIGPRQPDPDGTGS